MKRRDVVLFACLLLLGGLLIVSTGPASADPPLTHCHGEATIDNQGGTFPGPFTSVVTGRNNCSHVGVQHNETLVEAFIDLPVVFCVADGGGPGVTGTVTNLTTASRPDGKSQVVLSSGPTSQCFPITPPTGIVTTSSVSTSTILSATGKYAKDGGAVGCTVTQSVVSTIDYDAVPLTQVYDTQVLSVTC